MNARLFSSFAAFATLWGVALGAVPPAVAADETNASKTDSIVVAAGCFWCMQAAYERVPGVVKVTSGYAGGTTVSPSYEQVGTGTTGHSESVLVEFDPAKVNLDQLFDVFWRSFDPTDGHGVYPDFGTEYRSLILYRNDAQKEAALASKAELQKHLSKPVATEIKALDKFWPAEAYHQDYVRFHPNDPYVQRITIPRLTQLGLWGKPIVAQMWPQAGRDTARR